jgi:fibronectin type 3 domain-containing protein
MYKLFLRHGAVAYSHGPDYVQNLPHTSWQTAMQAVRGGAAGGKTARSFAAPNAGDVRCVSDPTTQPHTELIYAYPSDGTDNSGVQAPALVTAFEQMSAFVNETAASLKQGAGDKFTAKCSAGVPTVAVVHLTTTAANTDFDSIDNDLTQDGYTSNLVHYLTYYDGPPPMQYVAGQGSYYPDEEAKDPNEDHNTRGFAVQYGDGDPPTWDYLLHEASHNMGAVGNGSPNSTNNGHCNDGQDVMCYADGGSKSNYNDFVCGSEQYDCNHDDYFAVDPTSGYLASHWNIGNAENVFLWHTDPAGDRNAPTTPTGLAAPATYHLVNLTWNASTDDVGVTGYKVYYTADYNTWTLLGTTANGATNYTDTTLPENTWRGYRVAAVDAAGNESPSSTVFTITSSWKYSPPTAPTSAGVTAADASGLTLNWSGATDSVGVRYYDVERKQGGSYVQLSGTATAPFVDHGAACGQQAPNTYTYEVAAINWGGTTGQYYVFTTPSAPCVPTGLALTGHSTSSLTLEWNANSDPVTHYVVWRQSGASWSSVAQPASNSYTVTGLAAGTTYHFAVSAYNSSGGGMDSGRGSTLTAATDLPPDTSPPTTPGNVMVNSFLAHSAELSWDAASDDRGVTGYHVFASAGGGAYAEVIGSPVAGTSLHVTGLTADSDYAFEVTAVDAAGNGSTPSSPSNTIHTDTTDDVTPPSVPGELASGTLTGSSIGLTWDASTDDKGVTGYQVWQRVGGNWSRLAQTPDTTYTATGLTDATSYAFAVSALDASGNESATGTPLETATPDVTSPSVPGGIQATVRTANAISISWNLASDNVGVLGYNVLVSKGGGQFVSHFTASTSYSLTGLPSGTSYAFEVSAVDAAGNTSAASAPLDVETTIDTSPPTAPTGLHGAATAAGYVSLGWNAASDDTGVTTYRVYRLVNGGGVLAGTTSGLTYLDTSRELAGRTTTYYVAAEDAAQNVGPVSVTINVFAPLPRDVTAPTAPVLRLRSHTRTSIVVAWTAARDNVGVAGYVVWQRVNKGSYHVGTTGGAASRGFTVSHLRRGNTYSFYVQAKDAAGNRSVKSNVIVYRVR